MAAMVKAHSKDEMPYGTTPLSSWPSLKVRRSGHMPHPFHYVGLGMLAGAFAGETADYRRSALLVAFTLK